MRQLSHPALPWIFGALLVFFLMDANGADMTNSVPPSSSNLADMDLTNLMQIEVPVVTATSKIEQKSSDAPASVTVVTRDEIQKYGYRNLADVLRSVPGFNVSNDRNFAFLDARGVSLGDFNSRLLLLVDGHRVNNNLTDGALIDNAFILDIDLVDHIEVSRGPNAALYGNNAFFGVINVVTRQGRQINGFETSAEYGSFDAYKVRGTYGKLFTNGVEVLLSGTYYDNQGQPNIFEPEFNTPAQNNGVAHHMDGDKYGSLFGSLSYTDFTLESAFVSREKVNPTAQFGTLFNDPLLRTTDNRSYVDFKFNHSFPEVVDVMARVYYDRFRQDIGYPQTTKILSAETDTGEWWGSEVELNKNLWDRYTLTLGAEYRDDFHEEQDTTVYEGQDTIGQSPVRLNRQTYGIYGQGDFELLDNLHFVGGLRYDKATDFPSAVTPRLALIYHPTMNATLKAIYGTAFRTPNFYETTGQLFPISPEKIQTYELVYEQQWGPHVRSSLSGFYNQMTDLIVFNSGSFTNFNANTRGLELALEGVFANGIRGRVSYSYEFTHDETLGWQMPDSPNHLVKLNLDVPVWRTNIFAGLEFQYVSDRLSLLNTTDSSNEPLTLQGQTAGAYTLVNFTLFSRELVKNLEVSASVYNLFNTHYLDPASNFHVQDLIPQEGRTFRVKATYRF